MNVFNCLMFHRVIVCIHISNYFGIQYNNRKNKAGIFSILELVWGLILQWGSKNQLKIHQMEKLIEMERSPLSILASSKLV